jgi:hypothetical protein
MEKIFTVEEANRTLPLVGRIVDDLVRDHARWEDKVREFELATVGASPDHPDAIADLLQVEAQRLARDIEGYIAGGALGIRSADTGLVDFRGQITMEVSLLETRRAELRIGTKWTLVSAAGAASGGDISLENMARQIRRSPVPTGRTGVEVQVLGASNAMIAPSSGSRESRSLRVGHLERAGVAQRDVARYGG